jgi:photoactive yellow protein
MATTTTNAGPWNMIVFAFDENDKHNPLGNLAHDDILRLPFGAAELSREGRVVSYNDTEPDDGSSARASLVGRSFFDDIASWAKSSIVEEEFQKGVLDGSLNVVFDCSVGRVPYRVRIHLKISPILGTYWVFVKKLRRVTA